MPGALDPRAKDLGDTPMDETRALLTEALPAWREKRHTHPDWPNFELVAFVSKHGPEKTEQVFDLLDTLLKLTYSLQPAGAKHMSLGDEAALVRSALAERFPQLPEKVIDSLIGDYMFANR